jgi:nitroreductase
MSAQENIVSVASALQRRVSTRGFLPTPVPRETLENILGQALQAPSNCNVQPWNVFVVSGAARDRLSAEMIAEVSSGMAPYPDFFWEMGYKDDLRKRQVGSAFALYDALGIERQDRERRTEAMIRNWDFFGAPHGMFFVMEKYLQFMGAVDLGIFAQTVALLMAENGIDTCFQGALNHYPGPARRLFNLPENQGILFGMSFGYLDQGHPANKTRTEREPLDKLVRFVD